MISNQVAARLRGSFGLRRGVVTISPAHPAWAATYHLFVAELLPHLPTTVVAVEHIGSTAVPGLPAKPILDMAIGLRTGAESVEATEALVSFGFSLRGESTGPELDSNFGFELEERVRLVNAHLVRYAGREWSAYLSFRDRLRADETARDEYAKVKIELANRFPSDRTSYIDAKTAFIVDDGKVD